MTINEAIYKVVTTQFKKDMGEAKKIVRGAGYTIVKWYGRGWNVKNEATGKIIYLTSDGYSYKEFCINNRYIRVKRGEDCKIDFVNALNKPINKEWQSLRWVEARPTKKKYEKLSSAKWSLNWRRKDVEKTKREIARLQEELIRQTRNIVDAENNLTTVRRELGLRNR